MKRQQRNDDLTSNLKPIGAALAAVVAGLGPANAEAPPAPGPRAPLEPAAQGHTYMVDHTNHPGFDEDPDMVVGRSEPVAVFGAAPKRQGDLFKR